MHERFKLTQNKFKPGQKRQYHLRYFTCLGTQNHNGLCVFDCVPCGGELKTGEQQEIQVTFYPDHESRHYSDGARFVLFNSVCICVKHEIISRVWIWNYS